MDWAEFAARAVAVPFAEKGRDFAGWDCWGLICCGYREVLGIELPSYAGRYRATGELDRLRRVFGAERDAHWRPVERRVGAVAMILRRNARVHVGIAITSRGVLHCEAGAGTVIDRDRDLRIDGFWEPAWTAPASS